MEEAETISLILFRCGHALQFPMQTTATALVYYHKHCAHHGGNTQEASSSSSSSSSSYSSSPSMTAKINLFTAILFLAGKGTENIRRIREVLNVVRYFSCGYRPDGLSLHEYQTMKEAIIEQEHALLRILVFKTEVDLPHVYLLNIARYLQLNTVQIKHAWKFLNAALLSNRILLESPALVAIASLHLGCVEVQDNNSNTNSNGSSSSSSHCRNGTGNSHPEPSHQSLNRDTSNNSRNHDKPSTSSSITAAAAVTTTKTALCDTKWWTKFDVSESTLQQTCQWIKELSTRIPSVPSYII